MEVVVVIMVMVASDDNGVVVVYAAVYASRRRPRCRVSTCGGRRRRVVVVVYASGTRSRRRVSTRESAAAAPPRPPVTHQPNSRPNRPTRARDPGMSVLAWCPRRGLGTLGHRLGHVNREKERLAKRRTALAAVSKAWMWVGDEGDESLLPPFAGDVGDFVRWRRPRCRHSTERWRTGSTVLATFSHLGRLRERQGPSAGWPGP